MNAASRLARSDLSVELVTGTDNNTCQHLADELDALNKQRQVAERELRAAIDNPVVLTNGMVSSNGNFHGAPLAHALDFLAIVAADSVGGAWPLVAPLVGAMGAFRDLSAGDEALGDIARRAAAAGGLTGAASAQG